MPPRNIGPNILSWLPEEQIEESALQQIYNLARMPFIHKHIAVMPDCHYGLGATVGSCIPTLRAIIPAAVGVDQDALLAPGFAPAGGVASNRAPPNALYPWSSPPTAIPSPLRPVPRNPPPGQPRCPPAPHPTLEGPMDGAIVSQLPGQVVPLTTASHPKDNAFQHLPLVRPFAPPGFGRIQLQYHRSDSFPEVVRNIPNSG